MSLQLFMLLPLFAALFACILPRNGLKKLGYMLAILAAGLFLHAYDLHQLPVQEPLNWFGKNLNMQLALDGLSRLFVLLITGIGTFIFLYTEGYFSKSPSRPFYIYLTLFMMAMLGIVLANDLISLFIFWELTSLTSFLLIGFHHDEKKSRLAAAQALIVTALGGVLMLAGLLILAAQTGTTVLSEMVASADKVEYNSMFVLAMILILIGAMTKSAQFPFSFWLPNAMAAPTPVSAYLHSATMVTAGVYLLARLNSLFVDFIYWQPALITIGFITSAIAVMRAATSDDLKRILAFSTVAILGQLVLLIGVGTDYALYAMAFLLVAHSFYKAALFMVTGGINKLTGNITTASRLARTQSRPLFAAASLAGLSMIGVPGWLGFVAKEEAYHALSQWNTILFGGLVAINTVMVVVALLAAYQPFTQRKRATKKQLPLLMGLAALALGILSLAAGLIPQYVLDGYIAPAAIATGADPVQLHLSAIPKANMLLLISLVSLIFGIFLYKNDKAFNQTLARLLSLPPIATETVYNHCWRQLRRLGNIVLNHMHTAPLRVYVLVLILSMLVGLTTMVGVYVLPFLTLPTIGDLHFYDVMIVVIMVLGAAMTIVANRPLSAVIAMGVTGLSTLMIYIVFGAPDLALTQLMFETLLAVILVMVLVKLPTYDVATHRRPVIRLVHFLIAATIGLSISLIMIAILNQPLDMSLSDFYANNSYLKAHGRNVVNVILVDFRGFDTLGEILVVATAALACFGLLKLGGRKK